MEWIRSYILTLTAAGILCAIVRSLAGKGRGLSLACGAFLILAALGPFRSLSLDTDQDEAGKTRRERTETVILSRGSSSQEAVVSQVVGPKFRGAVVVCGGGDDPAVRLAIVQAVCSVTGLGADQVTVLKMK